MEESVKIRIRELVLSQIELYDKFNRYSTTEAFIKENSNLHIKALDDIGIVSKLQQEGIILERNIINAALNLVHITTIDPAKTQEHVKKYKKAMKIVSKKTYLNDVLKEL